MLNLFSNGTDSYSQTSIIAELTLCVYNVTVPHMNYIYVNIPIAESLSYEPNVVLYTTLSKMDKQDTVFVSIDIHVQ